MRSSATTNHVMFKENLDSNKFQGFFLVSAWKKTLQELLHLPKGVTNCKDTTEEETKECVDDRNAPVRHLPTDEEIMDMTVNNLPEDEAEDSNKDEPVTRVFSDIASQHV